MEIQALLKWIHFTKHKNMLAFSIISQHRLSRLLKSFTVEDKDLLIMYSQCQWPGATRSQGISSQGIVLLEYLISTLEGLRPYFLLYLYYYAKDPCFILQLISKYCSMLGLNSSTFSVKLHLNTLHRIGDHFVYVPSQWETTLQCNIVFHWLDGLVQERRNSIANALELHLSCTNPLKWSPQNSLEIENKLALTQGLYSLSGKTSYRQISWSLEAVRLGVIIIAPLWNLTGTSAALLPRGLSNFRAIGKV